MWWWENHPDQEYEYRHAGIVERHGTLPVELLLLTGLLFVWGLVEVILRWTA